MKRFLAFFITLILIFSSVGAGFTAFAADDTADLERFTDALVQMIRTYEYKEDTAQSAAAEDLKNKLPMTYEKDYFSSQDFSAMPTISDETSDDGVFAAKRLIVKSEKKIDLRGAAECISGYRNLYILQYASVAAAKQAFEYYSASPDVIYAEPDFICATEAEHTLLPEKENPVPQLSVYGKPLSYVSDQIGFESIKSVLESMKLSEIVVAHLDSGVDTDHELLADRLLPNDVNLSNSGNPDSCEDDFGHGTHTAGILADNTLRNVKIRPYKVLDNNGKGPVSLIALAIDQAAADGADIINMSLTCKGESQTMRDAVNRAVEKNINVVVAAGNDSTDLSKTYYSPACIESAVTVSAATQSNTLAAYSNYNGPIDIAAPGSNVKSSYLNNTYTLMSGTSMAAPLVSAGLSVVRSAFPQKTAAEAEAMLKEYAIQIPQNAEKNEFGSGILYLKYILQMHPQTADPVFSAEEGVFSESFSLRLSCPEKDATILYILNSKEALPQIGFNNGTVYKAPFTISTDTKVTAVAIAKGKLPSAVVTKQYTRAQNSEDAKYDIDRNGNVTAYFGTDTDIVIPDTIRGIPVRGIGARAFKGNTFLRSVTLPDTATAIGLSAFTDCTALQTVKGAGIRQLSAYAFQNSAVSEVLFPQLNSVGTKAFAGCRNLLEIDLSCTETIDISAFENAAVRAVVSDSVKRIGTFAFRGSAVETVSLANIQTISPSAFVNCAALRTVSAPCLTAVSANTFENCSALQTVDLPNVTSVALKGFSRTALKIIYLPKLDSVEMSAFSGCFALEAVLFPQTTSVSMNAFENCVQLHLVFLPKLPVLKMAVFKGCRSLTFLSLPAVETVQLGAFDGIDLQYLQLDSVKTIQSLPSKLKNLVLSSSFSENTAALPQSSLTIFGIPDTNAQKLAETAHAQFRAVPAIVFDAPESFTPEDEIIAVYAVGFHCKYQWYKSDSPEQSGTPIAGADSFWYTPAREDNAAYYYCVIESNDGTYTSSVTTHSIRNAPELQDADYTAYTAAAEQAKAIDRSLYSDASLAVLDSALAADVQNLTLAEQATVDMQTEAILQALAALTPRYTAGDINNDGRITAVDARWALQAASGTRSLSESQTLAADVNGDARITAVDARWILQAASGTRKL